MFFQACGYSRHVVGAYLVLGAARVPSRVPGVASRCPVSTHRVFLKRDWEQSLLRRRHEVVAEWGWVALGNTRRLLCMVQATVQVAGRGAPFRWAPPRHLRCSCAAPCQLVFLREVLLSGDGFLRAVEVWGKTF